MARLPRLVLPGQAHYIIQRGHNGQAVFTDPQDRAAYLQALRLAAANECVVVHAYALLDTEVQLLATPTHAAALSRMMQALGRHYVSAYNLKHARGGALWDGRFRCAPVEPGAARLHVLRLIDGQVGGGAMTSADQRLGATCDGLVTDPPEVWDLGNTPFDREAAYRRLLAAGLSEALADQLRRGALRGWWLGSTVSAASPAPGAGRALQPRPRGRPRQLRPGG